MTCATLPVRKWDDVLLAGESDEFEVDLSWALARKWESRDWEFADTIRLPNGLDAQCSQAGRSGVAPPPWPITPGQQVTDGGAKWITVASSGASLETTAQTITWEPPTGISQSGGFDSTTRSVRKLAVGADVEPGDYTVMVTVERANGTTRKLPCVLTVAEVET